MIDLRIYSRSGSAVIPPCVRRYNRGTDLSQWCILSPTEFTVVGGYSCYQETKCDTQGAKSLDTTPLKDGCQLVSVDTAAEDGFQPPETAFDLGNDIDHVTQNNSSTAQEVEDLFAKLEKQDEQKREKDDTVQERKKDGRAFGHKRRGHKGDAKSEDGAADKADSGSSPEGKK
jgi:hypothetical protein